ncbi:MAG: zinc-binding dehydrogenase [Blautia sp.]|nr:zinc-binding dehydrogenase [Blautia sp.]
MKATIYYGPKNIKLEEIPKPVPTEKDVIVKVMRAGICGSDLKAYLYDGSSVGIFPKGTFGLDGQFGHEMVGVVDEIGADVEGIAVGDRVFVNPTVCRKAGMLTCDMSGAFSEYVLVEEAKYGYNLLKLSDSTTFDEAVMTEPLSVATHGKNVIDVKPYEKVVIFGAGTIGLCALEAVLAIGCKDPVIIDMNEERLALAERLGGTPCNPSHEEDGIAEFLMKHFGVVISPFGDKNCDVDVFIDCAGAAPVVENTIKMAKHGARICIVAVHKKPVACDMILFGSSELTMKGSLGYQMTDVLEAYNNIDGHRNRVSEIVTHQFPIDQILEAFEVAANPETGAIKVVINYEM